MIEGGNGRSERENTKNAWRRSQIGLHSTLKWLYLCICSLVSLVDVKIHTARIGIVRTYIRIIRPSACSWCSISLRNMRIIMRGEWNVDDSHSVYLPHHQFVPFI
jgi:hypothetical protein